MSADRPEVTTTGTRGAGSGSRVAAGHEHVRRLVAVHLEDGATTRELACEICGAVWFT